MGHGSTDSPGVPRRTGARRRLRRAIWLLALCAAAAGAFFAWDRLARPWMGRWEVERMMARYAESPDQATADRLVEKLVLREVDAELGNRILALLVTPEIITRSAYRSDRPVMIATEYPCVIGYLAGADARYDLWAWVGPEPPGDLALWLRNWQRAVAGDENVEAFRGFRPGHMGPLRGSGDWNVFQGGIRGETHVLRNADGEPKPLPVGTHEATVLVTCAVMCPSVERRWQWPSSGGAIRKWIPSRVTLVAPLVTQTAPPGSVGWLGPADYHCQVKLPVTIRVAEPGGEEKIELRTGPELDKTVRQALKVESGSDGGVPRSILHVKVAVDGTRAPENVFFRAVCRSRPPQSDGDPASDKTIEMSAWTGPQTHRVFWFRGPYAVHERSETFYGLAGPGPGTYRSHIVLTPDVDAAWPDPRIKTLYGGTVELPIAFRLDENGDVHPLDAPPPVAK